MKDNTALFAYDEKARAASPILCGVDEAGRGPLAGPVCCAAVILPADFYHPLLNDSKKVSEKNRDILYEKIISQAVAYEVQLVPPQVIDEINILAATMLGMKQAVEKLSVTPDLVLVDGNRLPDLALPACSVVKGDAVSASIAAASILAKVTRDRFMAELGEQYPMYQLEKHKGYPTKLHYEMIEQYGVQPFHRKSFLKKRGS